jgi:hypothetical protein
VNEVARQVEARRIQVFNEKKKLKMVSEGNHSPSSVIAPFTDLILPSDWADVCKADSCAPPKSRKMAQPTLDQLVSLHASGKKKEVTSN